MLYIAKSMKELDFRGLMDIYFQGNRENAGERYPQLPQEQGILCAEQDFYQYLRECFFPAPGTEYMIWQVSGKSVSALRLEPYRDGLLLEALETAPDQRRKGYARSLILAVLAEKSGVKIYSHVHKRNRPSLSVHEQCGFQRISEQAVYIDGSVNSNACTMCVTV